MDQLSSSGIPLADAAAFFIGLKKLSGYNVSPEREDDDEEDGTKTAADKSDAEQVEIGRQRAIANASSGFTSDSLTRGERLGTMVGQLIGGGVGVHAGNMAAHGGSPAVMLAGRLGGAALGQHVGAKAGRAAGQEFDGYAFRQKQWKDVPGEKTASCAAGQITRLINAPRTTSKGQYPALGQVPVEPQGHLVPGNLKEESRRDAQGNTTSVAGSYDGLQLGTDVVSAGANGAWDPKLAGALDGVSRFMRNNPRTAGGLAIGAIGAAHGAGTMALDKGMQRELQTDAETHPDNPVRRFAADHPVLSSGLAGGAIGGAVGALVNPLESLSTNHLDKVRHDVTNDKFRHFIDWTKDNWGDLGAVARFKRAAEELGIEPMMAAEQEGAAAQTQNELEYYRGRFQEAAEELGLAKQQVEELQAQVDQTQQTQQQVLDQATVIQQQAMANAQAAHESATNALQGTLQAQSETLARQQETLQVRDHLQAVKDNLLNLATQIPDLGSPELAAPPGGDPAAAGADPNAMPQDPAQGGPPAAEASSPTQAVPNAPPPPAPPPDPAAQGGPPGGAPSAGGSPSDPSGKVSIKVGNRMLGAIAGAGIGAAGEAYMARQPTTGLRGKIKALEQREQQGDGSFFGALNLAQSKFQLGMREAAQQHPTAAMGAGAALGALTGMRAVPAIQELAKGRTPGVG